MHRRRAVRKHFREPHGLAGDESGGPETGRMIRTQPRGALVCSRLGGGTVAHKSIQDVGSSHVSWATICRYDSKPLCKRSCHGKPKIYRSCPSWRVGTRPEVLSYGQHFAARSKELVRPVSQCYWPDRRRPGVGRELTRAQHAAPGSVMPSPMRFADTLAMSLRP